MRLSSFILENLEPILGEWEAFARSVWPGTATDPLTLRDHARDILRATALDMMSAQTAMQQSDKSKGEGDAGEASIRVDGASDVHAIGRVRSGFDLLAVVAEYRALRASVIRLWRASAPNPDARDLGDVTRFNESIDQSLTEAIRSYTQQVDQSRQLFLAILGHDLRAPLNALMMCATALAQGGHGDAEVRELTSGISSSTTAMAKMIGDLLAFTESALSVTIPISTSRMDLSDLCREVFGELRTAHPTHTFKLQLKGDLTGDWDVGRLRQVISNLLGNAVQHGADAGPIELEVIGDASDVLLSVHNLGPPIPADAIGTIFDPLARGAQHPEKKRRLGSIGLGLYIARQVVSAHQGAIGVRSSTAAGTCFEVRLPRYRGATRDRAGSSGPN